MGGYICLWVSMTTLNSEEITLWSASVGGVYLSLSVNDNIEQWRDHSVLCQIYWGGYIVRFTWCHTDISWYLPISWLFRMGSHWLHWKAKSSLWALAVSNGGYIIRFTWCHTDISLYLPISWLFWMGSHWLHWKSEEFTLCSGSFEWGEGDNCQFYPGKSENLRLFKVLLLLHRALLFL